MPSYERGLPDLDPDRVQTCDFPAEREDWMIEFTEDQAAIQATVRDFVRREIAPVAAKWDREGALSLDVAWQAGALGLFGICIPETYGGAGANFLSYVIMTEELAFGDAGFCNMINATNSFAFKLAEFGTDEQKERFLKPVASGRSLACMLLTEPQAGSDASNLLTRAERRGDSYVLNGSKCFITSGRSAEHALVIAVTDPSAGKRGISAFIVETRSPGYRVLRSEHKLGHRTNETCQIELDNLEVPATSMLGRPGEGLKIALSGLEIGRIAATAQSVGVARAALHAAVSYAKERTTFGKRLFEHQAIAFQLAEMATDVEIARTMCLHAGALKQAGRRCTKEASMAKLFASQMCEKVCSAAIQIHGGYGYVCDYPVEKYYRDARVFQIYDGTNEVQKMVIAREILQND